MEQDKQKKLFEKEERRSAMGGGVTFGPKETEQTIIYQNLKKKHDQSLQKKFLTDQILTHKMNDLTEHERKKMVARENLTKAHLEVSRQNDEMHKKIKDDK